MDSYLLEPRCPKCRAKMLIRSRAYDGQTFFGCIRYPECRGTRSITQRDVGERYFEQALIDLFDGDRSRMSTYESWDEY